MWMITIIAALLTPHIAVGVTFAASSSCQNPIQCPCGSTGRNVTVCDQTTYNETCKKFSNCKACQDGLNSCLQCSEGLEGPFCSEEIGQKKSRQKRQYYPVYNRRPNQRPRGGMIQLQRSGTSRGSSYCTNLDSPKLGSIRCITNDQQRTCVGKCLPGYTFERYEEHDEITLFCQGGVWTPLTSFPPCKSGGHCDLIVHGSGSFNCTTGMQGTRCDVNCNGRYVGRYFCFPGEHWDPHLPQCVIPKEIIEEEETCHCEYGASCDSEGHCVCPAGRTGEHCEIIIPERTTCRDPGFISNGFRRNTDGSSSNSRRTYEEGQSVVYGCNSEELALQGSSLLTCRSDSSWSSALPKCIQPIAAPERTCSDPGQVANADRLNSDGNPSMGVQQYRVGQSVVYTCHQGFALQRRSLITCLASGAWSSRVPYCSPITSTTTTTTTPPRTFRFCSDPGIDPNGSRQPRIPPSRRGFPQGTRLEYSCNSNYDLSGGISIFCLVSGGWSANRPRCDAQSRNPDTDDEVLAYCPNPGRVTNGQVEYYPSINSRGGVRRQPSDLEDADYPEGSQLQYICNNGYVLQGTATLVCERSGLWSAQYPVCRRNTGTTRIRYCRNPGRITDGRVVYLPSFNERRMPSSSNDDAQDVYPEGGRLQYTCDNGYTIEGEDILTCQSSGVWSTIPPTCVPSDPDDTLNCESPERILNGRMQPILPRNGPRLPENPKEYPEGTRIQYTCDEDYKLQGSQILTCRSSFWVGDSPSCQLDCGKSFMQSSPKVIGGINTTAGEFPWVVAIKVQENGDIICGGAVLNSRTVITAAHCLTDASTFILYFGKHFQLNRLDDEQVQVRRTSTKVINPDYGKVSALDSDIGLIIFEPKIEYTRRVQPICPPTGTSTLKNLKAGRTGYVAGFGLTEKNRESDELLLAALPVINNRDCIESYSRQNISLPLSTNMFCAGYATGRQTVCFGDSGSPLIFYDAAAEKYTLEGIVSFGTDGRCGRPGRYAVFTKVIRFLHWIMTNAQ